MGRMTKGGTTASGRDAESISSRKRRLEKAPNAFGRRRIFAICAGIWTIGAVLVYHRAPIHCRQWATEAATSSSNGSPKIMASSKAAGRYGLSLHDIMYRKQREILSCSSNYPASFLIVSSVKLLAVPSAFTKLVTPAIYPTSGPRPGRPCTRKDLRIRGLGEKLDAMRPGRETQFKHQGHHVWLWVSLKTVIAFPRSTT